MADVLGGIDYDKLAQARANLRGVATGGSNTTLEDTDKDVAINMYQNGRMHVRISGKHYVRYITSNTASEWTFDALPGGVSVSSGDEYWIEG